MSQKVPCMNPESHQVKSHLAGSQAAAECARGRSQGTAQSSLLGSPPPQATEPPVKRRVVAMQRIVQNGVDAVAGRDNSGYFEGGEITQKFRDDFMDGMAAAGYHCAESEKGDGGIRFDTSSGLIVEVGHKDLTYGYVTYPSKFHSWTKPTEAESMRDVDTAAAAVEYWATFGNQVTQSNLWAYQPGADV